MLSRRRFLGIVSARLLAGPLATEAPMGAKIYRVGFIAATTLVAGIMVEVVKVRPWRWEYGTEWPWPKGSGPTGVSPN